MQLGRIRSLTTVQTPVQPNVIWVEIETDSGHVGLGETFFGADAVAAYLHETVAGYLLGKDPLSITAHWEALYRLWSRKGVGAEARGASATDIALWDLFGKSTGLPLYQLLGGKVRPSVPVYNTCIGPGYQSNLLRPGESLFGVREPGGHHEDLWAFLNEPEALAESLLAEGITTMKIFPFDATLGLDGAALVSPAVVEEGVSIVRRIRERVGDRMDIAIEMRSRWQLPSARRIVAAVEPYRPVWIEDPIRHDHPGVLAEIARGTTIPIAAGENIGSRHRIRELLDAEAVGIVLTDPAWCGGVTEARRIAELAAVYGRPFGSHDCAGPVNMAVGTHLGVSLQNTFMQEIARSYIDGWYADVATGGGVVEHGQIAPSSAPGHGVFLAADMKDRQSSTVRTTSL